MCRSFSFGSVIAGGLRAARLHFLVLSRSIRNVCVVHAFVDAMNERACDELVRGDNRVVHCDFPIIKVYLHIYLFMVERKGEVMPQLSLYLDDAAMEQLRSRAKNEGMSLSRYARRQIGEQPAALWPDSFWGTYGALCDETFELPQELDFASDTPRGSFDD